MLLSGVCYHALGEFENARRMFQRLLKREPKHVAWFRMESMLYSASVSRRPLIAYCPDNDLDVVVRDGITQGDVSRIPGPHSHYNSYDNRQASLVMSPNTLIAASEEHEDNNEIYNKTIIRQQLVESTSRIGRWVQLTSPGFLPNKRNHVSFGLSVLQAAQTLARHVYLKHSGRGGLYVPDSMSSKLNSYGAQSCEWKPQSCDATQNDACPHSDSVREANSQRETETENMCPEGHHLFGWRDYFDILVRWRQVRHVIILHVV